MKAADVTPLTVVYQRQRGQYGLAQRAVVLSRQQWLGEAPVRGMGITSYRPVTDRDRYSRNVDKGWLVLIDNSRPEVDLIPLAAPALAAVEAGGLPADLPEGVRVTVVRAQEIIQTWEDHEAREERLRVARLEREDAATRQKAADAEARQRIAELIGEDLVRPFDYSLKGAGAWERMEKAMTAYHLANTDAI